jgi:hypothetical protein
MDGDNTIDTATSFKATTTAGSETYPGELAKGYNYRTTSADVLTYTIPNLVPGKNYYAKVSAINAYGTGGATLPSTSYVTPPKQIPEPPANVTLSVHAGSSTTLDVYYDAPTSNGGADIIEYRVELDTSVDFTNPIHSTINCEPGSTHSVFEITTASTATTPITGGSFALQLEYNGNTYTTEEIPYNAPASSADEVGVMSQISGLTATATVSGTTFDASSGVAVSAGVSGVLSVSGCTNCDQVLFVGDLIKFTSDSAGTVATQYEKQLFRVEAITSGGDLSVSGNMPDDDDDFTDSTYKKLSFASSPGTMSTNIHRVIGGRGTLGGSKVACYQETADQSTYTSGNYGYGYTSICSAAREDLSGSVETKLEFISDIFTLGVEVDRDEPDAYNGVTWRVTFLDDALSGTLNWDLTLSANTLTSGGATSVTITELLEGSHYTTSCVGTQEVPDGQTIVNGQYYYARVFAKNSVGYSLPQIAPTSEAPQVTPGAPTAVTLEVVSDSKLRVTFNPPSDDGGDAVTSYKVEYSTDAAFSTVSEEIFTYLEGGSPFQKTISDLTAGTYYYFRVSAGNAQGYGDATASTPSSLNPHSTPDAPTNVLLKVTSHSMLTVSWEAPTDNGGDTITEYQIEWDTASGFNSGSSSPHKGTVDVDATSHTSYTISTLTAGANYYVRVFAKNSMGYGMSSVTTPVYTTPALQVPGKPHTLIAVTGASSGEIILNWQYPRVPWHNLPCSGTVASPTDCPTETGGTLASSTGGSAIVEYSVQYSELQDFTGYDTGEFTTTGTTYTLTNLTPGRTYYLRVLARNAQGSGSYCSYTDANCIVDSSTAPTSVSATSMT